MYGINGKCIDLEGSYVREKGRDCILCIPRGVMRHVSGTPRFAYIIFG